jgi:hydroxymethylpyrimidine pyrophosphatase-like HAD family hydrolase
MLIALDYDGTYTADPELWQQFIQQAVARGHEVLCVTMRHEHEGADMCQKLRERAKVIFTGRRAKAAAMGELNVRPSIWIDDNPHWIFQDA